jgi:Tfp pilus assembly PilM family ATPase
MHVLAIDAGSYSVKFISSFLDKRRAVHGRMEEYVIQEELDQNPSWENAEEASRMLIKRIVDENARQDTRIVMHVPPEAVTTRFLTLPVKNRKKAELMIPFQLEEDIPFSLSDSHYSYALEAGNNQSLALVALTRDAEFSTLHDFLETLDTPPSILTSEPSVMDAFYSLNRVAGPFCVLDIGHRSTKAYFFYNSKLIATHVSYVGGRHIDEMISQTYGIGTAEAVVYKHQNAFVLTPGQLNDVDENQREFARLMDQVFRPLNLDFQRWDLGFRVAHGMKLSQVFLCGGTSNIKNMANYLTEKFAVKCSLLESFEGIDTNKVDLNPKSRARFTLANMMALSQKAKGRLINLLSGRYAQSARGELPLHTLAFIGTRAAAVTTVVVAALVIHHVLLTLDLKAVNAKITAVSKNPALGLSAREKRLLVTQPMQLAQALDKKQRSVRQQISTLQSATQIKALSPLVMISAAAAGVDAMMTSFKVSDSGDVSAAFTAEDPANLTILQGKLQGVSLNDVQVQVDLAKKELTLTGME